MEEFKKKSAVEMNDKEIIFSKSIKAGKRIYYLDVKKNRKDEMPLPKVRKLFPVKETIRKLVSKSIKSFYTKRILKNS